MAFRFPNLGWPNRNWWKRFKVEKPKKQLTTGINKKAKPFKK